MFYQDTLGRLYDVPDNQVYGLGFAGNPYGIVDNQMLYDGLGNPVGAWPFDSIVKSIGGLVSKALPAVASFIPGGSLISQALPAVASALAPSSPTPPPIAPPVSQLPVPMPAPPGINPLVPNVMPPVLGMQTGMGPGSYAPGMRPWPHGWLRPQIPYTGLGPQRLYLRCSTWPGPAGLVPAIAAQAPVPATQAAAAAAAQTASALMRRRPLRHHRR